MKRRSGFTIIEVVLFLAISSGLAIFLLVGTSAAIQRQQYRDSVQSFASFLRGQYERVISVENDREPGQACPISGSDSGTSSRGQSNCMIIGRYIETVGATANVDGRNYQTKPVYAIKSGDEWRYGMGAVDQTYNLNWNAKTKLSIQSEGSSHVAILIYRDPDNGQIIVRTNSGRYGDSNIGDFFVGRTIGGVVGDAQFSAREICVYDSGWMLGERLSIFLGARAGSGDAVTVDNAGSGCRDA